MKEVYLFLYLNEVNPLHKGKGWMASTVFAEFPTVEQILDHTCLESSNSNDVLMAQKLVESQGKSHRFVYEGHDRRESFFECMIVKKQLGEPLNLWDYFLTGYADMDESRQIMWEDYK